MHRCQAVYPANKHSKLLCCVSNFLEPLVPLQINVFHTFLCPFIMTSVTLRGDQQKQLSWFIRLLVRKVACVEC